MSRDTGPAIDDAAIATGFPCACGDPLLPGLHRTRGGDCEHEPPRRTV